MAIWTSVVTALLLALLMRSQVTAFRMHSRAVPVRFGMPSSLALRPSILRPTAFFAEASSTTAEVVQTVSPPSAPEPITIKQRLMADMKQAMRNKEKDKLEGIRSIQAAIKQKEVDERVDVNDEMVINIISKLIKQRKESIKNFEDNGRPDLAEDEKKECAILEMYLPAQMSEEDVIKIIDEAVARLGASTIKDMGKVMGEIRPVLAGKFDNAQVGSLVKKRLPGK